MPPTKKKPGKIILCQANRNDKNYCLIAISFLGKLTCKDLEDKRVSDELYFTFAYWELHGMFRRITNLIFENAEIEYRQLVFETYPPISVLKVFDIRNQVIPDLSTYSSKQHRGC